MARITGAWSHERIETFLAEQTIPLRLGCVRPADDLWMLSLWYRYRSGVFECATAADAAIIEYLDHDPVVAFEVSTNEPPYRGVRGNGIANVTPDEEKTVLRALLDRYLADDDTPLARRLLAPERDEVTITITPDRLHSWDYSDRM